MGREPCPHERKEQNHSKRAEWNRDQQKQRAWKRIQSKGHKVVIGLEKRMDNLSETFNKEKTAKNWSQMKNSVMKLKAHEREPVD